MLCPCTAYCEGHLCNAIEEHLQSRKEEEARIQVGIIDAVRGNVGPQEQRGTNH